MRSLFISYVAVCYAFELKSQILLVKTPKPNPVRRQALCEIVAALVWLECRWVESGQEERTMEIMAAGCYTVEV